MVRLSLNKLVVVVVFSVMALGASAQTDAKFRVGGMLGLNISNFYGSDYKEGNAAAGIRLGFVGEYNFNNWIGVAPELIFAQKGTQTKRSFGSEWVKSAIRPCYIQIPINAVVHKTLKHDITVFGIVGPYLGFGVGGNYSYKNSEGHKEKEKIFGHEEGFRRFDFGLTFGVGAEWKNIFFRLHYELGCVNLVEDVSMKNSTFNISAGYYFLRR